MIKIEYYNFSNSMQNPDSNYHWIEYEETYFLV